jgi:hypothetical protein
VPSKAPALVVVLAALSTCGGGGPDLRVRGVQVVLDTTAPFASQADFPGRLESMLQVALDYWHGSWRDLAGKTVTLVGDLYVDCAGMRTATGCYDGNIRASTRDVAVGTLSCVEQTVLVHEIGHAVIGDPLHQDPRWMEMDAIAEALAGRTGYAAGGEVPCPIVVGVWRHPVGTP